VANLVRATFHDQFLIPIDYFVPGTAGYGNNTWAIGHSYADSPVLTPVIYNPDAAQGSRWSAAGLSASTVPRMYHSAAVLLPDGEFGLLVRPDFPSSHRIPSIQDQFWSLVPTLILTIPLEQALCTQRNIALNYSIRLILMRDAHSRAASLRPIRMVDPLLIFHLMPKTSLATSTTSRQRKW